MPAPKPSAAAELASQPPWLPPQFQRAPAIPLPPLVVRFEGTAEPSLGGEVTVRMRPGSWMVNGRRVSRYTLVGDGPAAASLTLERGG